MTLPFCASRIGCASDIKTLADPSSHEQNLRFSHKILLAASLIVIAALRCLPSTTTTCSATRFVTTSITTCMQMGDVTASNHQTWLTGRIALVENAAQNIAINLKSVVASLLEQKR